MRRNVTMKSLVYAALFAGVGIGAVIPSHAYAECYGDAAAMYGCGVQGGSSAKRAEGTLEYFGDSRAPVLPDVAYNQGSSISDEVITNQDRRRMLRSIILGGSRRPYSQRSHIQAINNSGRPLRRSGAVNQAGAGR
jgi:hypothetical protein